MTFRGKVVNGRIELLDQPTLPEGAVVSVVLQSDAGGTQPAERPSLYDELKDLIGSLDGLPEDFALQHDHYIYGLPKR